MKKVLIHILSLLWVSVTVTMAQDTDVDSLRQAYQGKSNSRQKLDACRELARYYRTRNFDDCIEWSQAGLKLAISGNDIASSGEFRNYIGETLYLKGNYDSAAIYYYQALDDMNKARNATGKGAVLNSLGKLYRKTRDLDRALQNYDEAYAIYKSINDEEGMATILNESGVVFEYKQDYAEAVSRYERSLKIREKLNDLLGKSYSLNFIGGAYTQMKKFDEAEKYLIESLDIRKQLKDSFTIALSYSDLGAMYSDKKDYARATQQYLESNRIAENMHYPQLLADNFRMLSSIAENKGDHNLSLSYYKTYAAIKDSLITSDKLKQIEALNAKYQDEKKVQQLKVQEYELKQKNFLLLGLAFIAILVIISSVSIYLRKQAQSKLALQQAVMRQQDIAAKAVIEAEENERRRIAADLHDGVGQMMSAAKMNLSAFETKLDFSSEDQRNSFHNALGMIDESCKEIRNVSHQMMPNALLKSGLASAVKEFTDKIDPRVLKISYHTEGMEERAGNNIETVLYRVIQECVNNVIKHSGADRLDISIIKDKDGISATIEDNGKGFESSDKHLFEGIGLKNIISRVDYLKGSIDFDSAPGKGTLVAIHIPV